MKKHNLSPRIFEHMVGLAALAFLASGMLFYVIQEPQRIEAAQAAQQLTELEEAMTLYAQNCSICHGLAGEGIGATPPLDNPAIVSADAETLSKIISRGLYGTSMPAWSKDDGGPLSDYQINVLVTLILKGDWQSTQERVVNLGLAPLVPFTTEPDQLLLEQTKTLPDGEKLARGIEVYAAECVACHGADGAGTGLAPALNDPLVRQKDASEIERIILNGVPGTLMAAWENTLPEADIDAVMALITRWDVIPVGSIPAPDQPVPVTAESLQLGADLYAQSCARCHGVEGQGTRRAPSLNVKGYLSETNDAALQQIITLGVPGTAMPAWGDRITDTEIQAVVGFIRSWEPTAPEVAIPARGGGGPWWKVEGGTQPGKQNSMPSGGVQTGTQHQGNTTGQAAGEQNTGEGSTQSDVTAPNVNNANSPQGNRAGQTHPQMEDQAGQEAQPNIWQSLLDWRVITLLGVGFVFAVGLIGSGYSEFKKFASH